MLRDYTFNEGHSENFKIISRQIVSESENESGLNVRRPLFLLDI